MMAVQIEISTKADTLKLYEIFLSLNRRHIEMLAIPGNGVRQVLASHLECLTIVPCAW